MLGMVSIILGLGPIVILFFASFIIFVGALLSDAGLIKANIAYNKKPYKQVLKAFGVSIIVFFIYYIVFLSLLMEAD